MPIHPWIKQEGRDNSGIHDSITMTTYTTHHKKSHRALILSVCEEVTGDIVYLDNEFAEFTRFAQEHKKINVKRLKPVTNAKWKADEIKRLTGVTAVAQDIDDYVHTLADNSCAYIWFDYCGTTMPYSSFEAASKCVKNEGGIAITLSMRCNSEIQDLFIGKSLKKIGFASDPPIQYYGCSGIRNMKIWFSQRKKKFMKLDTEKNKKRKWNENLEEKTFKRPRGRAPLGCEWDYTNGTWTNTETDISDEQTEYSSDSEVISESQSLEVEETNKTTEKIYPRPRGKTPTGFEWDYIKGEWAMLPEPEMPKKNRKFEQTSAESIGKFQYKKREFFAAIVGKCFYDKNSLDMIILEVDGDSTDILCGKPITRKAKDVVLVDF